MKKKLKLIEWTDPWKEAFGNPEIHGLWIVLGKSGNGKSALCGALAKEFSSVIGKVIYNSLEERFGKTFQNNMIVSGAISAGGKIVPVIETLEQLDARLDKPKSPKVVIIDSIQALGAKRSEVVAFIRKYHMRKLLIFVSQSDGKKPRGKVAEDVWFFADLKIWVEGFKAISHGRHKPGGSYTIWPAKANLYWGQ